MYNNAYLKNKIRRIFRHTVNTKIEIEEIRHN